MRLKYYNDKIHTLAKAGNVKGAKRVFEEMCNGGLRPNVLSLNSMLLAAQRGNQPGLAVDLFGNFERYRLLPDCASFQALISAFAKRGELDRANYWLAKMKEHAVKPNQFSFTPLLNVCARNGDVAGVNALLSRMAREGVMPDRICKTALLEARIKSENSCAEDVIAVFDEIERDFGIDLVLVNNMLHYFAKQGDVDQCKAWFDRISSARLEPDLTSFNCLLDCYAKASLPHPAASYIQTMRSKSIQPNVTSMNCLIEAYSKAGDPATATRLLLRHKPNVITFSSVISAWGKRGEAEIAYRIFEMMIKRYQIKPSETLLTNLLKAFSRRSDGARRAEILLDAMHRYNLPTSTICVNCVIDGLQKDNRMADAIEWFEKLERPDAFSFSSIIHGFSSRGDMANAEKWLNRMRDCGIEADGIAFHSTILAAAR